MAVTPQFIGQIYEDTLTGEIYRANSLTTGDWSLICSPGSSCSNKEGSGDPDVVTPDFIGQTYVDLDTGNVWQAQSLTIGDWTEICSPTGGSCANVEGAGDPSALTPQFFTQVYKDTDTGNIWRANGLTPGAWAIELQNAQVRWTPTNVQLMNIWSVSLVGNVEVTSLDFENTHSANINVEEDFVLETLTSSTILTIDQVINASLTVDNCDVLSSIHFPVLTDVEGSISISNAPQLTSIQFEALENVSIIDFDTLPLLTTVSLGDLTTASSIGVAACDALTSLGVTSLVTVGAMTIINNPLLTDIVLLSWVPTNGSSYSFQANALNDSTVNLILAQGVANAGFVTGVIDTSGGTNAAPSGQGIVDKATLQGRGVTVSTN